MVDSLFKAGQVHLIAGFFFIILFLKHYAGLKKKKKKINILSLTEMPSLRERRLKQIQSRNPLTHITARRQICLSLPPYKKPY